MSLVLGYIWSSHLEMQHVFIYIESWPVSCILKRSEKMWSQGENSQNYWELKLDWLNKNVGGKIKTGMVGMGSCFLPLIYTPSTKHKQEDKLRSKSCWWRDTWKQGAPSWSTKKASWHKLRARNLWHTAWQFTWNTQSQLPLFIWW